MIMHFFKLPDMAYLCRRNTFPDSGATNHRRAMFTAVVREYLDIIDRTAVELQVRPVILKGAALAFIEYPSPLERPMTDIDLYIPPADALRLARALVKQGMNAARHPLWRATFHYSLKGIIKTDIHFALHAHASGIQDGSALLEPIRYPGFQALMVPSPAAHAAYVVMHAYTHGFSHPHWRSDVCVLLNNHPEIREFWNRLPISVALSGLLHFAVQSLQDSATVPTLSERLWSALMKAASFLEPDGPSILVHRLFHRMYGSVSK